jgi:putative membrane protein
MAKHVVAGAVAVGLFVAVAAMPARAVDESPGKADRDFIIEAASAGLMEVELGRIASTHASSEPVKQFGQRMVVDHSRANAELKELAAGEKITLPDTMNEDHRTEVTRLSRLQGAEFDRAYMQAMVNDHEQDVTKFRDKERSAYDPDVKAFAARTLPMLEEHLRMAKEIFAAKGRATSGPRPHAGRGSLR